MATSPCDGLVASRRELRLGARLVPLCGIPKYLDEQVSKSKTLHRSQADSLSLQVPPQVSMHKLDNFAEHVVQVRVYLIVWQPMKSKVLQAVRSALKFRNCSVPPGQSSLGLPFLAHQSFSTNVQACLRSKITQYKHWLIPLHLPSSRMWNLRNPTSKGWPTTSNSGLAK